MYTEMNLKRTLILVSILLLFGFFVPKISIATDASESSTYKDSIITRIREGVKYFFTFKTENKIQVLEQYAEKRLNIAQNYADEGNGDGVQSMIQSYQQIKERQNELLGKIDDGKVLEMVTEQTIEQQKTMEEIKTKINEDGKQNVIQVQEEVVNQVANHVVEVNGTEERTEFLNEVLHVWAPGTGPGGGEAGVTYAGGGKLIYAEGSGPGEGRVVIEGNEMKFAPDASAGGPSGSDIKTEEVKNGNVVEEKADPGTDDTRVWIDP